MFLTIIASQRSGASLMRVPPTISCYSPLSATPGRFQSKKSPPSPGGTRQTPTGAVSLRADCWRSSECNKAGCCGSLTATAFGIESRTGELRLLNRQATGRSGGLHIAVDPTNRYVVVPHNPGGIAVLPIQPDGSLAPLIDFADWSGP